VDFSVIKQFVLPGSDRSRLEFRAEFFNLFNHPNFANPSASQTSAAFGRILTTAVNPRIVQLALKYAF
jgi:hypothetical protein